MGSLALLKHWSNTKGQDITAQYSSNPFSFFKTLNRNFSHITKFKGHFAIWFIKFSFPADTFPFLLWPGALYEGEMTDGFTELFMF